MRAYLAVVKQRRPSHALRRRGIKQQLQYLRRNLGHIEQLLAHWPPGVKLPLPRWLLSRYWVLQHVYDQQWEMYRNQRRRCDDRIVSISQPYVRPIVRGKQNKAVEFGAKLSVSLSDEGLARVDHLRWDAFHEGHDLPSQVEAYRARYGYYPKCVLGDAVYGSTIEDLSKVYAKPSVSCVRVGSVHQDKSLPAFVITDDLLGKHFAILGTTGSGKSCAVALILRAILSRHSNGHVLLLDPHNEYSRAFGQAAELVTTDDLELPYWLLNFEAGAVIPTNEVKNSLGDDLEELFYVPIQFGVQYRF